MTLLKQALKYASFFIIQKMHKHGQAVLFLANSFKKRPKLVDLALKKSQMAILMRSSLH